jgi:hypothetical protein
MCSPLLNNALTSIRLGIDDYVSNDPDRAISAVRNYLAGVLLLAKEVLVTAAGADDPMDVLAKGYKPQPNHDGSVSYVPAGSATVDFSTLAARFRDFDLSIDSKTLDKLNIIRNQVEHFHSPLSNEALREAIATSFPVVVELIGHLGAAPAVLLPETWPIMLRAKDLYAAELEACRRSFDGVRWEHELLADAPIPCIDCASELVAQTDPDNQDPISMQCVCRACGAAFDGERAIESALAHLFDWQSYIASTDGGDQPVLICHECARETYVAAEGISQCVACGAALDECGVCSTGLTPDNFDSDNSDLRSSCGNRASRD